MKLSKTQQEILDLMDDGWELGQSLDLEGRCWIQKGGLGKGGEARTISGATVRTLREKRLIEKASEKFPLRRFRKVDQEA